MTRGKVPTPMVLVIDDEALIRWSLSEGLTEHGYVVRQAGTGAEARAALASVAHEPLVVVLDLRLPDVADFSLIKEIRAKRPEVPLIVITAHGTVDDAAHVRALGVSHFVTKPFDIAAMVSLVGTSWSERPSAGSH